MNSQLSIVLGNLLIGCAISSVFFVLPNDASLLAKSKQENIKPIVYEANLAERNISQAQTIKRIIVIGNTVLTEESLASIIQPLQGKALDLDDIKAAAESITQLYISKGYATSRAEYNSEDRIVDGVVQIRAIEGELERVDIIGTFQTNPDYVRSRVELGVSRPFNANLIEDQLQLLRADPLFRKINASLKAGTLAGKSLLVVQVEEANKFGGSVSFDNYAPVSVGSERLGAELTYRNLTGYGDLLTASYYGNTSGGGNLYDFSYIMPINPMNGTVAITYSPGNYRITDPAFAAFNIRGGNSLYDIVYRQPLIRSPREEFALSLGFAYQTGQTFLFENLGFPFGIGPDANGVATTSVFRFGQDYTLRDNDGAWSLRSQFNLGTGLLNATYFEATPTASFFSWLGQAQRVHVWGSDSILIASLEAQLSANPLLPSQQFTIGGGQSVRGFRQNARVGDNGLRLSVENRLTVMRDEQTSRSVLQLAPFIDIGSVWNNSSNPIPQPPQNFLAGSGLGVIIEPIERLIIRIDGAIPLVNLLDRGNNLQDLALYFSVGYRF